MVIDTSAWIDWLVDGPARPALEKHWPARDAVLVPTLVQLELAKWLTRERGEDMADQVIAYTMTCDVVPLETAVALQAAELCGVHKLATADAIVYATALQRGARLLTCDAHFEGLQDVILVRKEGGGRA